MHIIISMQKFFHSHIDLHDTDIDISKRGLSANNVFYSFKKLLCFLYPDSKIFCQIYGCIPTKYLFNLRMNKTQWFLIHEPFCSVRRIGEICGYHDQSYFSRIFKKYIGKSPLEFREEHNIPV